MTDAAHHMEAQAPEGRQVADVQEQDAHVVDPAERTRMIDDLLRNVTRLGRWIERQRQTGGPAR